MKSHSVETLLLLVYSTVLQYRYYSFQTPHKVDGKGFLHINFENAPSDKKSNCCARTRKRVTNALQDIKVRNEKKKETHYLLKNQSKIMSV